MKRLLALSGLLFLSLLLMGVGQLWPDTLAGTGSPSVLIKNDTSVVVTDSNADGTIWMSFDSGGTTENIGWTLPDSPVDQVDIVTTSGTDTIRFDGNLSVDSLTVDSVTEAQGTLMIGDATPEWVALPIGNANDVLITSGGTAAWTAQPTIDCTNCTNVPGGTVDIIQEGTSFVEVTDDDVALGKVVIDVDTEDLEFKEDAVTENLINVTSNTGTDTLDFDMSGIFTSVAVDASADPVLELNDSEAPGASADDKEVGAFYSNYIDGAEDSENSDIWFTTMQGGARTTTLLFDESDDQWETTKPLAIGSNPAEAGSLRLDNAAIIGWEDTELTQEVSITVDAAETFTVTGSEGGIALATTTATESINLEASDIVCHTTNGCAAAVPAGTNFDYNTADYATDADDYGSWTFNVPDNVSGTTLTAIVYWTSEDADCDNSVGDGGTPDTVCWFISIHGLADTNSWHQGGFSDGEGVDDICITAERLNVSDPTDPITHSWSAGDRAVVRVKRDTAGGDPDCVGDEYTQNARLLGVKLSYEVDNVFSGE
jgi:hypothetical protein